MLSVHDRLKYVRKELGYTQEQIGEICGIKKSAYSMIETGSSQLSKRNFEILTSTLNINKDWLLKGEGEMFDSGAGEAYFVPAQIKARPTYIAVPVYDINIISSSGSNSYYDILRYLPFCNARSEDVAVVVSDSSMAPEIDINSVVLLRRSLGFNAKFDNNKKHLIILKDGRRYIRTLMGSNISDIVICKSPNKDFDDSEVELNRIAAIYRVMAVYCDSSY